MDGEPSQEVIDFCAQLLRLNKAMDELFEKGNIQLFGEINAAVKELHAIQSSSHDPVFEAIAEECKVIYVNSDMIVRLLRTTENGVIDKGIEKGLNKFLHNIDDAVVNIAGALGLV